MSHSTPSKMAMSTSDLQFLPTGISKHTRITMRCVNKRNYNTLSFYFAVWGWYAVNGQGDVYTSENVMTFYDFCCMGGRYGANEEYDVYTTTL